MVHGHFYSLPPLGWILLVVLGLVIGSFLGCAIYRVPRGLSLRQPPSHCPQCHTRLTALDLVPVFSWLCTGQKCRHCGVKVGGFYAFVEALTAALFVLAYMLVGLHWAWLPLVVAASCAVFATMVFYKNHTVSVKTLVFGLFCVLLAVLLWHR